MDEIEDLKRQLKDYEDLNISPKRRLCKCGRKPKLRIVQYGFKDSDEAFAMACDCGNKYPATGLAVESRIYSEKEAVKGWNKEFGKY